jgi:hypothetical protein
LRRRLTTPVDAALLTTRERANVTRKNDDVRDKCNVAQSVHLKACFASSNEVSDSERWRAAAVAERKSRAASSVGGRTPSTKRGVCMHR